MYFTFLRSFRFHELEKQARSREHALELQLMELKQRQLQTNDVVKQINLSGTLSYSTELIIEH